MSTTANPVETAVASYSDDSIVVQGNRLGTLVDPGGAQAQKVYSVTAEAEADLLMQVVAGLATLATKMDALVAAVRAGPTGGG